MVQILIDLLLCPVDEIFIVSSYVTQLQEEEIEDKWRESSIKNYIRVAGRDGTNVDAFDQDHSHGYSSKV